MPRFSDSTTFRDLSTSRWVLGRWRCGTMGTGSYSEVFALSWTHTRKFILLLWTTESGLSWWYSFSRKCGQNQLGWDSFIARDIWFQSDSWKYQDKALDLRRWCHGSFWPWPRDHHCLRKETQSLCPVTSSCFWRHAQKSAKKEGGMDAGWNDSIRRLIDDCWSLDPNPGPSFRLANAATQRNLSIWPIWLGISCHFLPGNVQ